MKLALRHSDKSLRLICGLVACLAVALPARVAWAYDSVTSIALEARDPETQALVSSGGEDSTSWPVGVTLKLKAMLSEDRPERTINFVGERGEAPNVTAVWNDSGTTTAYAPKLANAYTTINTTGLTKFTAIDPSELEGNAGTVSNVVKITMVGVDRIIVDEVADEDQGPIWIVKGLPIALRAIPVPADAPFPDNFPKWTATRVGGTSSQLDGTPVVRIVPGAADDYTALAACGITSKTMQMKSVVGGMQRDIAGGVEDFKPLNVLTRKVLVGQKMILRTWAERGPGVDAASIKWTLGGVNFKDWTANQTDEVLTPMAAADLSNGVVSFYWTDPEADRGVTAAITLTNGARLYVRDEFNVQGPMVIFTTALGAVAVNTSETWVGLFGPAGGISFWGRVIMPWGFADGEWNWVQTIEPAREEVLNDAASTRHSWSLNGTVVLDTTYPYFPGPYTSHPGTPASHAGSYPADGAIYATDDSPASALTRPIPLVPYKQQIIDDEKFVMTIMFLPPGVDSRYVPTQSVEWGWSGTATNHGLAGWSLDAGTGAQWRSTATSTTTHPVWNANFQDGFMQ